jgi:hypothetical protein
MQVPVGSIAELLKREYSQLNPDQRSDRQTHARTLLSAPLETRRKYFGADADHDTDTLTLTGRTLNSEMQSQLGQLVRARLDAHQAEIKNALNVAVNAAQLPKIGLAEKTWVEVGSFGGDIPQASQTLTITHPQTLNFHWHTDEAGAELGRWELFRKGWL